MDCTYLGCIEQRLGENTNIMNMLSSQIISTFWSEALGNLASHVGPGPRSNCPIPLGHLRVTRWLGVSNKFYQVALHLCVHAVLPSSSCQSDDCRKVQIMCLCDGIMAFARDQMCPQKIDRWIIFRAPLMWNCGSYDQLTCLNSKMSQWCCTRSSVSMFDLFFRGIISTS